MESAIEFCGVTIGNCNGRSFLTTKVWRAVVPKIAGVSSSASQSSDTVQFVSISLFSGVGLLISLIIVILRMNGI